MLYTYSHNGRCSKHCFHNQLGKQLDARPVYSIASLSLSVLEDISDSSKKLRIAHIKNDDVVKTTLHCITKKNIHKSTNDSGNQQLIN